jgi:hypothetical protein
MKNTIPELVLVVLIGAVGLRQIDLCESSLQSDGGPFIGHLPRIRQRRRLIR